MSTSGNKAESFAAKYIKKRGYEVIDRNWKNRFAEIDIIAEKDEKLHFIEVKFRKNPNHGAARSYLTPGKIRQVKFATKLWLQENNWNGPIQIDGIAITGSLNDKNTEMYLNI